MAFELFGNFPSILNPTRNCVDSSEGALASQICRSECIKRLLLFNRFVVTAKPGKERSTVCPSCNEHKIELQDLAALLQRMRSAEITDKDGIAAYFAAREE